MDHVALIGKAQSDAPAQRRGDSAVGELQFLIVDLRLIRAYGSLKLPDGRVLRIHLLLGDYAFLAQLVVTRVVDSGIVELRLVASQLSLHLLECHLEGPGIDFRKEIAFPNKLAFRKINLLELSIDSALHGDGIKRSNRPQPGEIVGNILFKRRRYCYRHHRRPPAPLAAWPRSRFAFRRSA